MEILLDKNAGFCFGVKRAVDTVYDQLKSGRKIYTYGPIVHNDTVVKELEEEGVSVIPDKEALINMEPLNSGEDKPIVIIRAHGISEEVEKLLESRNFEIVDATCPFVKKIHRLVEKAGRDGFHVIIIGNPDHPEIQGIVGWCTGPVTVLRDKEEALQFVRKEGEKLFIVSQTTYNHNKFKDIVEIFRKKDYNDTIVDTICNATDERQKSAKAIAADADVMIVIGGKQSSNSAKLYDICKEECEQTYFIQTLDDLNLDLPKSVRLVGITAGASTPNKLIEEVQNYVRINF